MQRFAGRTEWLKCRMYKEWMEPQGYLDACGVNLSKNSRRHAMLSVIRHAERSWFRQTDFRRLRLVSPHIRRAVTITDLLGKTSLHKGMLSAALDLLTLGVVLVDRHARIVYANRAAENLLDSRAAVRRDGGQLAARDPASSNSLREAVATATSGKAAYIPHAGIAVPLPGGDGREFAAWVLPLDSGLRNELAAPFSASAAVFLREIGDVTAFPGELFVKRYEITPAECRVLMVLVQGMTPTETAAALGISEPTVRTHLQRLFTKTGTRRQAELMRLTVNALSPVAHLGGTSK